MKLITEYSIITAETQIIRKYSLRLTELKKKLLEDILLGELN